MAKKSTMSKAADAVKTVAGTALGAAAAAAAVKTVADAVQEGGAKLDKGGPTIQKSAANAVPKPILPIPRGNQREQRAPQPA
jgi:hypothetical protein